LELLFIVDEFALELVSLDKHILCRVKFWEDRSTNPAQEARVGLELETRVVFLCLYVLLLEKVCLLLLDIAENDFTALYLVVVPGLHLADHSLL
jgi:hypothetical protein